ncbi:hypothetical protein [Pseudomonas mohnii]
MKDENKEYSDIEFEIKLHNVIERLTDILGEDYNVVEFVKCHFRLADNQSKIQNLYEQINQLENENTALLIMIDKTQNKL